MTPPVRTFGALVPGSRGTGSKATCFAACLVLALVVLVLGGLGCKRSVASRAVDREALPERPIQGATHEPKEPEPSEYVTGSGKEREKLLRLDPEALRSRGVLAGAAAAGLLEQVVTLSGEVVMNPERAVHVMARVAGTVRSVHKRVGDPVAQSELLAVLDSRELADARSGYLLARERLDLAESRYHRVSELWQKQILAEKEYLETKQAWSEAGIELHASTRKLLALGLLETDLAALASGPDTDIARYEIRSPIAGRVIERHLALGDFVQDTSEAFLVADLGTVWIQLNVYNQDVPRVHAGQSVEVHSTTVEQAARGTLQYVDPVIDAQTRTAVARVVLQNADGAWRPGQFVTARVVLGSQEVPIAVPDDAIQMHDHEPVVFVEDSDAYRVRRVRLGRSDGERTEILEGLHPGERIVVANSFLLKAELEKSAAGDNDD
jgi:cobalt-zinc-cadmium efflux system membrane fusion protein